MSRFELAWAIYPHYGTRSVKAISRVVWEKIVAGYTARVKFEGSYLDVPHQRTEEDLLTSVKAYRYLRIHEDEQYNPAMQAWLNRTGGEIDDAEKWAAQYDELNERLQRKKLRVVQ